MEQNERKFNHVVAMFKVFAKRHGRCRCGAIHNLQIHHKDFNPHNNHPDNLECLCIFCHCLEHIKLYMNSCVIKGTDRKTLGLWLKMKIVGWLLK